MIERRAPEGVIERWQPELDRISGPRTMHGYSHLRLLWEPGEDWCPVGRWMIWECMPAERAPLGAFLDLRGPNPRAFMRYDRVLGRPKRERNFLINRQQWVFYQETGLYGRPIWVVQGKKGGHKRFWTDVEQSLAQMMFELDEPPEPPAPGDLCYAAPDSRTINALRGMNLVKRYGDTLRVFMHDQALRDSLDRREGEIAQEMARQVYFWLDDQLEEGLQTMTRKHVAEIWNHASDRPDDIDYDRREEDFITAVADRAAF